MEPVEHDRTQRIREDIDVFIRVMRLHHRIVEKRIDGCGVHHSQHRMLMKIFRLGKSASQKELAAAMEVSPACVARMLKQLNAAGLVEKSGGADGRCNEISLLPAGNQVVEDSRTIFHEIGDEMFDGVSSDEIEALGNIMGKLLDNLSRMEGREAEAALADLEGDDRAK
ncbi:MAG: MarR family transcriptional regulator [Clostridia bacterium]|nr:MarR family transcriptional regulator [Clostridia bacterium]